MFNIYPNSDTDTRVDGNTDTNDNMNSHTDTDTRIKLHDGNNTESDTRRYRCQTETDRIKAF